MSWIDWYVFHSGDLQVFQTKTSEMSPIFIQWIFTRFLIFFLGESRGDISLNTHRRAQSNAHFKNPQPQAQSNALSLLAQSQTVWKLWRRGNHKETFFRAVRKFSHFQVHQNRAESGVLGKATHTHACSHPGSHTHDYTHRALTHMLTHTHTHTEMYLTHAHTK